VAGLGTDGQRWQAWLNLDKAAALLAEEPEDLDDVSLWMGTPAFDEAVRTKRAELEAVGVSRGHTALTLGNRVT
jgi:hypothetical protein